MIVEIQCLAFPPGVEGDTYRHIEAAIRVIERSGLAYEVGALGTTLQGPALKRATELVPVRRSASQVRKRCSQGNAQ